MSEWTKEMEERADRESAGMMPIMLAEIRRLREELGKANAKAEQYERDWYDAKAEFGQSMKRLRAAGARAMQEKALRAMTERANDTWDSCYGVVLELKPEDV